MKSRDLLRPLLLCLVMFICAFVQVSAASVVYKEEMRTYTDRGYVRVGRFEVDGKTAFCMEHSNESPPTGTAVSSKIYKNEKIRKILYYGWEGPGQWSGFTGYKQGITLTSLLLSETYTTAQPVGTYNFVDGLVAFRNYVQSQPAPDLDLRFSKTSVKAFYDKELDAERTEDITVLGSGAGKLTVTVPEGLILHNNKTSEEVTGVVVLGPGDSFYLRTVGNYSEIKTTQVKGKNMALQPIVFVTASTSLQDLTRLELAEDTAETTKLTVNWVGKLNLRILKKDIETGESLKGAEFLVERLGENDEPVEGESWRAVSDENGVALLEGILICGRRYRITETSAPDAYCLNAEPKIIEVTGDNTLEEVTFNDEKQKAYIIINKKGRSYVIESGRIESQTASLEGAEFEITAAEDITGWNGSIAYRRGQRVAKLVTDENGQATTEALPPGRYSISETKAPPGYEIDREVKTYNLSIDEGKNRLEYNASYINKVKTTEFTVIKRDLDTEKPLADAHFRITDSKGRSLEICTDGDGKAVVRNLPPGTYTLTEVEAPRGYELETKSQAFIIEYEGNNSVVVIEAYDRKKSAPATDDDQFEQAVLYIIILGISFATFMLGKKHRKRMKKH